jgi:hypothetical protein
LATWLVVATGLVEPTAEVEPTADLSDESGGELQPTVPIAAEEQNTKGESRGADPVALDADAEAAAATRIQKVLRGRRERRLSPPRNTSHQSRSPKRRDPSPLAAGVVRVPVAPRRAKGGHGAIARPRAGSPPSAAAETARDLRRRECRAGLTQLYAQRESWQSVHIGAARRATARARGIARGRRGVGRGNGGAAVTQASGGVGEDAEAEAQDGAGDEEVAAEGAAATRIQALARGHSTRAAVEAAAAAATHMQALARGRAARAVARAAREAEAEAEAALAIAEAERRRRARERAIELVRGEHVHRGESAAKAAAGEQQLQQRRARERAIELVRSERAASVGRRAESSTFPR